MCSKDKAAPDASKEPRWGRMVLMKPVCARTGMCGLDFRINWTSSFVFCQLAEKAFTMAGLTTRGNFLRLSIWSVNCSVELFFISLIFYRSFCKKSEFWFFFFLKGTFLHYDTTVFCCFCCTRSAASGITWHCLEPKWLLLYFDV